MASKDEFNDNLLNGAPNVSLRGHTGAFFIFTRKLAPVFVYFLISIKPHTVLLWFFIETHYMG